MKTVHITQLNAQLDARRRADAETLAHKRRDLDALRNLRQVGQAAVRELERQLAAAQAFLAKTDETVLRREWEIEHDQGYSEACTGLLFEALPVSGDSGQKSDVGTVAAGRAQPLGAALNHLNGGARS